MWQFLRQPYPKNNNRLSCILSGLFFGLFVFAFLWIFRPFGLEEIRNDRQISILAGYGLITAIVIIFHNTLLPLLFSKHFDELNWTTGKEITHTLLVILVIGMGNVWYSSYLHFFDLSFDTFLRFQFITLVIAVLPVSFMVMIRQIRLLKRNLKEAHLLSEQIQPAVAGLTPENSRELLLVAENEKDQFSAPVQSVLFISAADNYIEIVSDVGQEIRTTLLRSSLKRAVQQLETYPSFYRCHRTYLVNLSRVKSVTGNAQGYKLIFENHSKEVPVSRNLNREISQLLAGKKS